MKRLCRAILEDYEIPAVAPSRVRAVQFGADAALFGLADRLLDDANRAGLDVGVALAYPGDEARRLAEQDGLYTVFVRGDLDEREVRREQAVQSVLKVCDPGEDEWLKLAKDEEIAFAILSEDETGERAQENLLACGLLARFLAERKRGLAVIVCGDSVECAQRARDRARRIGADWGVGDVTAGCRFFPALADCLTLRSSPEEAARLCAQMNYADAMIHLSEPHGRWTIQADAEFRKEFPLDVCDRIAFVDDLTPALTRKRRLFDAGLFALATLGCLRGDATLADCMRDEPLRAWMGRALYDEILPFAPMPREEAAACLIENCERYGNPLNDNELLETATGLLRRFRLGVLPAMRAYARERSALPEYLTYALAALILIYADARFRDGVYEVPMGDGVATVHDDPYALAAFSRLSSDMPPEALVYAALADRNLWGTDLREIDGLAERLEFILSSGAVDLT